MQNLALTPEEVDSVKSENFYIILTKYGKKVNENRYDVQGQTLNTVVMYDVKTGV